MSDLFRPRVSVVKGISDRRRLPRLGKVRLGIKVPLTGKNPQQCECKGGGCWKCTRPTETDYFVCPAEVRAVYGDRPKKLDVMFLVNDPAVVFPQARKYYGSSRGLKCTGDGERAWFVDEKTGEMQSKECPCPLAEDTEDANGKVIKKAQCTIRASLLVTLPSVNMGGIYQIDVGSWNSIVDVNSGIDTCRELIRLSLGVDRFAMIPLVLERVPTQTHHDGKTQTHYTLRLTPNLTLDQIQKMQQRAIIAPQQYALPEPEEIRPDLDGPVMEMEEEGPKQLPEPKKPEAEIKSDQIFEEIKSGTDESGSTPGELKKQAEAKASPQRPPISAQRSGTAMAWNAIAAKAGVDKATDQDYLRHIWVATFYGGKAGLTELTDEELYPLYRIITGLEPNSPEKKEKIKSWIEIQKGNLQPEQNGE